MNRWDELAIKTLPLAVIDAGCETLHEVVAEAFEPEFRALVARMYYRMRAADDSINGGSQQ